MTLYHDDCYKTLSQLPSNSIDLILTDPPYTVSNNSVGKIKFKTRKDINTDMGEWDKKELDFETLKKEFLRVIKTTGNIFIFASHNIFGQWWKIFDPIFDTTQMMVWHKTNPVPRVRKTGFLSSCELIFCAWNKGHTWNFTKQKEMHNFIETPICMGKERLKHPTQKPLRVLRHIINIASNKGDVVLDPFMGVGSTGVACLEMERDFIGMEIDKVYYDMARTRIKNGKWNTRATGNELEVMEKEEK